jgi:hypothetical protein
LRPSGDWRGFSPAKKSGKAGERRQKMKGIETELDQLAKLKGGPKHMWLREHSDLIIQFHQELGTEATMKTFNLTGTTLHNILGSSKYEPIPRITKADKSLALAEIARADTQELRQEVNTLKQLFERFQQSVGEELVNKFFMPLLQSGIKVNENLKLEEKNELSLDDIDEIEASYLNDAKIKRK